MINLWIIRDTINSPQFEYTSWMKVVSQHDWKSETIVQTEADNKSDTSWRCSIWFHIFSIHVEVMYRNVSYTFSVQSPRYNPSIILKHFYICWIVLSVVGDIKYPSNNCRAVIIVFPRNDRYSTIADIGNTSGSYQLTAQIFDLVIR